MLCDAVRCLLQASYSTDELATMFWLRTHDDARCKRWFDKTRNPERKRVPPKGCSLQCHSPSSHCAPCHSLATRACSVGMASV